MAVVPVVRRTHAGLRSRVDHPGVAVHADYLQALVDRNDLSSSKPDIGPKPPTLAIASRHPRRSLSLNAVRLLGVSGVVSWSIVAVETWMLVR